MLVRQRLLNNLKNLPGWRTAERLVVLAVDDYGNVRLDSAVARDRLTAGGVSLDSRFDRLDSLETRHDLEELFDVLVSVSDGCGRNAVFTAYAVCANPDFATLLRNSSGYVYESLMDTYDRLSSTQGNAYEGTWSLWQEGMRRGLLVPQFHGREHLNIELIGRKMQSNDSLLRLNLENQSMVALGGEASMPGIGFTQAFGYIDRFASERHRPIIKDGLQLFEEIFGFSSLTFTPPSQQLHPDLFPYIESTGVRGIDKPLRCKRRLCRNEYTNEYNRLGLQRGQNHVSLVRNVVFEPTNDTKFDSVQNALDQIAAAFRWNKPAIISSHRVNFCGHIEASNRSYGLESLRQLLQSIVRRWPDVQFIGADELVKKIAAST